MTTTNPVSANSFGFTNTGAPANWVTPAAAGVSDDIRAYAFISHPGVNVTELLEAKNPSPDIPDEADVIANRVTTLERDRITDNQGWKEVVGELKQIGIATQRRLEIVEQRLGQRTAEIQ